MGMVRGFKRQRDSQNRQFLVFSVGISSEHLELKIANIIIGLCRHEVPCVRLSGDPKMLDLEMPFYAKVKSVLVTMKTKKDADKSVRQAFLFLVK